MQETPEMWVQSLGQEDTLEKEMAIHSSIFAWRILWTEEPDGLQSMGSQRVGDVWATEHTHNRVSIGEHRGEENYISSSQVFSKLDNLLSVAGGQLQDAWACLVHLCSRACKAPGTE